nr:reverse transcriptase domain-containing protein [Tanacetum cinerariifolium]
MAKWNFELGAYDICYRTRTYIRDQILANFITKRPDKDVSPTWIPIEEEIPKPWTLFTDGSSCLEGSGTGLILINQEGIEFTYALRFKFLASNNEAEYEAMVDGLRIAKKIEWNNSLRELRFKVYGLPKVINNAMISECEAKGVTTRGGKMTTHGILNDNTDIHDEGPSVPIHDKPDAPKEILVEVEPRKAKEQVVQPSIEVPTSSIPFPRRLRKEKEKAQKQQFLENMKQLYINFLFIEDLAQMPKYAKLLKSLLTNKARLEDAYTVTMNERTSIRRIDPHNTMYSVKQEIVRSDEVKSEHLYSASTNEIDEKKPKLKDLPHHLEYIYLYGDKSFPIIILSKLSEKEKTLLLRLLEKHRGDFAWEISNIKTIHGLALFMLSKKGRNGYSFE